MGEVNASEVLGLGEMFAMESHPIEPVFEWFLRADID